MTAPALKKVFPNGLECAVLVALRNERTARGHELYGALPLHRSSVHKYLRKLQKNGFVCVKKSTNDSRTNCEVPIFELSEIGRRIADLAAEIIGHKE